MFFVVVLFFRCDLWESRCHVAYEKGGTPKTGKPYLRFGYQRYKASYIAAKKGTPARQSLTRGRFILA